MRSEWFPSPTSYKLTSDGFPFLIWVYFIDSPYMTCNSIPRESRTSTGDSHAPITPNFPSGSSRKIDGIMLRNRCWSIIFHTITTEDADGWC